MTTCRLHGAYVSNCKICLQELAEAHASYALRQYNVHTLVDRLIKESENHRDSLFGEAVQRILELESLVRELTDPDPCQYDHHGYCQAHHLDEKPCPHERAKRIIP